MQDWTPKGEGSLSDLPATLEPLKALKNDVNVLSGLALDKAKANGDGPGDHARAQAAFLTGRQARKTNGADIRAGQSADQWIAGNVGDHTRFSSLELGIEGGRQSGNCDSGYSCAYQTNFSWRDDNSPNAKEIDPKQVFDRLFGAGANKEKDEARAKRDQFNKSILDFVNDEAKSLTKTLGAADQRKIDEYLTAVREIELRIQRAREAKSGQQAFKPSMPAPTGGIPKDPQEHIRLMCDLLVLAFQADLTRVITFPLANDGSNRPYTMIDVREGHHELSHHQNDKTKKAKIQRINKFTSINLAYLLTRSSRSGRRQDAPDQSLIVYGSGLGSGNRDHHDDLPLLLGGHGGGKVKGGRHLKFANDTPLMNLYLAMFQTMGCPTKTFGDSTGVLPI